VVFVAIAAILGIRNEVDLPITDTTSQHLAYPKVKRGAFD
jgi:hypothetical protein